MTDVLLLGATGSTGRMLAAHLVARGLAVGLAGRNPALLAELGSRLDGARTSVRVVDLADPRSLSEAAATAGVVVSTVGPFARWAGVVVDACLAAGVPYVDIANEWQAVRQLLDRDAAARDRGVALVTGAGFGVVATEALVLRLTGRTSETPARVRVAAAAAVVSQSEGVANIIQEAMSQGAITYRHGQVAREPLGSGATVVSFGGAQRQVIPAPVGDLEAARVASGAPEVIAYVAADRGTEDASHTWAEVTWPDGRSAAAELRLGDGSQATVAIAAETAERVLAGAAAGAWTPCRLFGAELLTDATGVVPQDVQQDVGAR